MFDGYQLSPTSQTIRTDMEVGLPRTRRRTAARNDQISVSWLFTDAEMAIFRAWFDGVSDAAGGAAWFTVSLANGNTGIDSMEAKFVEAWQATVLPGLYWKVTGKLEVR